MNRAPIILSLISLALLASACEKPDCKEALEKFHASAPEGSAHVNLPIDGGVAGIFGTPEGAPTDVLLIGPKETVDQEDMLQPGFEKKSSGQCVAPTQDKEVLEMRMFHKDQPAQ